MGDDFPGKQVQNDGNVIVFAFQLITRDVADPYLIGPFRSEVLVVGLIGVYCGVIFSRNCSVIVIQFIVPTVSFLFFECNKASLR